MHMPLGPKMNCQHVPFILAEMCILSTFSVNVRRSVYRVSSKLYFDEVNVFFFKKETSFVRALKRDIMERSSKNINTISRLRDFCSSFSKLSNAFLK